MRRSRARAPAGHADRVPGAALAVARHRAGDARLAARRGGDRARPHAADLRAARRSRAVWRSPRPTCSHVYRDAPQARSVSAGRHHAAGGAALLAALGAGVAWGLLTLGWRAVVSRGRWAPRAARLRSWLLALPLRGRAGAGRRRPRSASSTTSAASGTRSCISPNRATAARAVRQLNAAARPAAGNRYDYWRIAWQVWREHRSRRRRGQLRRAPTTNSAPRPRTSTSHTRSSCRRSPSSGCSWALCCCACSSRASLWGPAMRRRGARARRCRRALMVAGVGAFAAWLAQTSVDWMAPAARAHRDRARRRRGPRPPAQPLSRRAAAVASAFRLGRSAPARARPARRARRLGRAGDAGGRRSEPQPPGARRHLPLARPERARRAIRRRRSPTRIARSASTRTPWKRYYVKAAALARFDQAAAAEGVLRQALAHEPHNFVTWALLGDIAVREQQTGSRASATTETAHELNPRDVAIAELAANPSAGRCGSARLAPRRRRYLFSSRAPAASSVMAGSVSRCSP